MDSKVKAPLIILAILILSSLSGCATLMPHWGMTHKKIDFVEVHKFGEMADYVYQPDEDIRNRYSSWVVAIRYLPRCDGKYFILKDEANKSIYIAIRGTANVKNALLDAEYVKRADSKTGVFLHKGFDEAADELYEDIQPLLDPFVQDRYSVNIAGHSLGGAMAALLMMNMKADGHEITRVITFGQPKVTNKEGVKKFRDSPMLRVIDERDVVPLVPPLTLVSADNGTYRHFGPEVILLKDKYFVYLAERPSEDPRASDFWLDIVGGNVNLDDHHMDSYMERIKSKLEGQEEVQFNDRKRYE